MVLSRPCALLLAGVASTVAVPRTLVAQDATLSRTRPADPAYDSQRKLALELFRENRTLEALPVLQELAKQKTDDAEVIFAWGTCLLDHSATLSDEASAVQERVKARKLLLRAKELGNNNGLLLNLLEILPEDVVAHHGKSAEVDQAMHDGEAAFAKNDY